MGLAKEAMFEQMEQERHESTCPVWDNEPCICNDECSRCGNRFFNMAAATHDPEDEAGICDDCWSDVINHD
jgi:hypothetical protein